MDKLARVKLFDGVDYSVLDDISLFSQLRYYEPGDIIISENDTSGYDLYLLLSGEVEIISNKSALTSQETVLSRDQKELFGEISWLLNQKRSATVRSVSESEMVVIDGDQFRTYMERHPQVGYIVMHHIAQLVATRLHETDNLLKQILWNSNI